VLANAIASMVDANGKILVEGLRPPPIPDSVRRALAGIAVGGNPGEPTVDTDYGEPGLTPTERVFGWNNLEVLAFRTGNPDKPVNAIPPSAV
ncbi:M20 peptidase family dipeptidase, partial [Paraburkholderia sp. SIMBA_030]